MRVLLDANVLISVMLPAATSPTSTIRLLFIHAVRGEHRLLVAEETVLETRSTLETRPWFACNVPRSTVDRFFSELWTMPDRLPALAYDPPRAAAIRRTTI